MSSQTQDFELQMLYVWLSRLDILPGNSVFLPSFRLALLQTLKEFRLKVFHSRWAESWLKSSFSRCSVQQYKASTPPIASTILISSNFLRGATMFKRNEKFAIFECKKFLL